MSTPRKMTISARPEHAELAEHDRPRVQEDELDVEQDEENRGQVELDRQAADREREGILSAFERLGLHGGRLLRAERRRQQR